MSFDGSSSFIEVPDNDQFDNWQSVTFSVWLKQDGTRIDGYRLVDKITAGQGNGFGFDTFGNGDDLRPRMLGAIKAIGSSSYSLNTWTNLTSVIRNFSALFHINGVFSGKQK